MANEKQQNDDDLFGGIDIDSMENDLITVDGPDLDSKQEEEIKSISEESGDSSKVNNEDPPDDESEKKDQTEETKQPDDRIIVDQIQEGKEQSDEGNGEKETGDVKDKSEKGGTSKIESESPVYLHAAALKENGVLPDFDLDSIKDSKPEDALLTLNQHIQTQIESSIKEEIDNYKNNIGERAKEFIDSLEKGIPFDDLKENYTLEEQFGSITDKELEENQELQEAVYSNYLAMKGFSEAKINKMVEIAKEKEELSSEAKDGIVEIREELKNERKAFEAQAEERKKQIEAKNKETSEKIENTVNSLKEILPGIEVTEQEKKELIKMLTVPAKYVTDSAGNKRPVSHAISIRMEDPIFYETRLNYLISKGFFEKDLKNLKLKSFMSKQESSAAKKLVDKLSGEKAPGGGQPAIQKDDKKDKDFIFPQDII